MHQDIEAAGAQVERGDGPSDAGFVADVALIDIEAVGRHRPQRSFAACHDADPVTIRAQAFGHCASDAAGAAGDEGGAALISRGHGSILHSVAADVRAGGPRSSNDLQEEVA